MSAASSAPRAGESLVGLHRWLSAAVRDPIPGSGDELRRIVERVRRTAPALLACFPRFDERAAAFDALGEAERAELIAEGLRFCATAGVSASSASGARAVRRLAAEPPGIADPVSRLSGVGPVTAARLAARGLRTVGDVLFYLPRAYDDLRCVTPVAALADCADGSVVVVRGQIAAVRAVPHRFLEVLVREQGAEVRARWYRMPGGMARQFVRGAEVALAGPLRRTAAGVELSHPANVTARLGSEPGGLGIRQRYPLVEGVAGRLVEKIAAAAVECAADRAIDILPAAVRERLGLPSLSDALRSLHRPDSSLPAAELDALVEARSPAHRRLALEDLLVVQLGLRGRKRAAQAEPARPVVVDTDAVLVAVRQALPFRLTGAQERAIGVIASDLAAPRPMQRLLQGDVGSGKTAVALAAAALSAAAGGQTVIMAPTEVLAEQHLRTLGALGAPLGLGVRLLTAATRRPERESTLALARAGRLPILIGTQALLDERVVVADLTLVIVDEQHRFGVAQRARLREKGTLGAAGGVPHLLVLTATPIPRTLAFTLYGDLDLTTLDELPPGRTPVRTRVLVGDEERESAYDVVRAAVAAGRQAFVVCPVLSESAREGAVTAVARYATLRRTLAPARVGLVHGRLDAAEKAAVLRAFGDGALDVLVATTVVEVGIDVLNATVMVVEEADRFGLAQLHQLRGRVGRGSAPGDCLLCVAVATGDALERLRAVVSTTDGFRIAEMDLRLRGHGDLFGVRQAGMPRLRFADFASYADLLELARGEAERLLAADPDLSAPEHAALRATVESRWSDRAVFGEEAG